MREAGLVDGDAVCQGVYAAAFDGDEIVALAGHCWNGNVLLEAPCELDAVAGEAVRASGRAVRGLVGPRGQVVAARSALGLDEAPAYMDSAEDLFALELARLQIPDPLAQGAVSCRIPRDDEVPMLVAWRRSFRSQHLHEPDDAALIAKCREEIQRLQREQRHFVLARDGDLVAYSAYNASTPECVQIGGVWTPPALRGRGFARAVVAGSLIAARARGVRRSVLFTEIDNHFAKAAYRALGYEQVGDYGMVMFER